MNQESSAAYRQTEYFFPKQQAKIIALMQGYPDGLLREEISYLAGLKLQSTCARVNELLTAGILTTKLLPDGVSYQRRRTVSGREAAVLILR